ncbi:MAG TPA: SDR family oxidoreductase [Gammaproteobacteria bacterium]|jgi:NADP-dependent 3-hydroxy acid dehydrogenase YdfG|nr:short-chain dehydrogenase [Acidiferrobacteraceae bacterium]MDE0919640.1 SDR family NAD(P)-dependent oxidoreductase [Arenicellales bacterium]MDP6079993.1 SDR family oxidoreductase [Arenicellales bacterium]HIG13204.1 SDR family oxidoreductase [Gammaproteobacteria bacterium]HIL18455.1 SDR family oxidoreductase [Gammaproteobacteria bacterium]
MSAKRKMLLTGAGGGIGRSIATLLLSSDWRIVGVGRDPARPGFSQKEFSQATIDLSDLEHLPEQLRLLASEHEDIDSVVCAAGVGRFGSLEEFSYQQIRELIDINLTSQLYVVRAFLPLLKRRGRGDVVLIGSEAALAGGARGAVYSATKFALRGFCQSLRQESAAAGIRVTLINPGMVRTDFFDQLDFEPGEDLAHAIVPEDIAVAVKMVLSARAETVFDEINLSPLKKVVRRKHRAPKP